MQSSLKKTLYLGLAVISMGAAAGFSTSAQAASKAKVTSDKTLTTAATSRNVNLTGTNAIYSKPGTVKGAKIVATATTAKNLMNSTSSHKNFRAYRVATTNRGSVYYKVVSFDKSYRGWVYGGKSNTAFAGGVASYATLKEGVVSADQKNGNFKLKTAGKTLDGVTYTQPAWTQYKVGRAILDTTAYKDASFSVDKVGTRTREGDTWVHIINKNTKDTKADGWILLSNLTQTDAFNEATEVKVNIVDVNGKTIKSFNYGVGTKAKDEAVKDNVLYNVATNPTDFAASFKSEIEKATNGTGYKVSNDSVNLNANVKAGSTLTLFAKQGNQAPTSITAFKDNGLGHEGSKLISSTETPAIGTDLGLVVVLPPLTTPFSGVEGADFSSSDVQANLVSNKATTLSTKTIYLSKTEGATLADTATGTSAADATNKTPYHVVYTFSQATKGQYGVKNTANAYYTAKLVAGKSSYDATSNTNNGSWANGNTTTTDTNNVDSNATNNLPAYKVPAKK